MANFKMMCYVRCFIRVSKGALEPCFIKLPNTAWGQGEKASSEEMADAGELVTSKPAQTETCLSVNGLAGFVPFGTI